MKLFRLIHSIVKRAKILQKHIVIFRLLYLIKIVFSVGTLRNEFSGTIHLLTKIVHVGKRKFEILHQLRGRVLRYSHLNLVVVFDHVPEGSDSC